MNSVKNPSFRHHSRTRHHVPTMIWDMKSFPMKRHLVFFYGLFLRRKGRGSNIWLSCVSPYCLPHSYSARNHRFHFCRQSYLETASFFAPCGRLFHSRYPRNSLSSGCPGYARNDRSSRQFRLLLCENETSVYNRGIHCLGDWIGSVRVVCRRCPPGSSPWSFS